MTTTTQILLALDDSEASERAVHYVADMLGRLSNAHVHLFHVLPPIPPELLEFGGAEDPGTERRLSDKLKQAQAEWVDRAKADAQPVMERAKAVLSGAGIAPRRVSVEFSPSIHRPDIPRDILEAAQRARCDTIVVGRTALSWLKEQMGQHVGEALVKKAEEVTIWVVG